MVVEEKKVKISYIPNCDGCGEPIETGGSCYAVQSGYTDEIGSFVRQDSQSQLFHIKCI